MKVPNIELVVETTSTYYANQITGKKNSELIFSTVQVGMGVHWVHTGTDDEETETATDSRPESKQKDGQEDKVDKEKKPRKQRI